MATTTTTYPESPYNGFIFGDPTVFNSSGTYTIPANASANSVILIEAIGGGAGGGEGSNSTLVVRTGSYTIQTNWGATANSASIISSGNPGDGFLGVFRLGFLSATPAGLSLTVTVGAGGNGSIVPSGTHTSAASGSNGNYSGTIATAGAASSVTLGGTTLATAAGGTTGGTNAQTNYTVSDGFASATSAKAFGPIAGSAKTDLNWTSVSGNVISGPTTTGGAASRTEWGSTANAILDIQGGAVTPQILTGPGTIGAQGTDATLPGQGGQPTAVIAVLGTTGSYTITRAGNGAQPGGPGGGTHARLLTNASVAYTFNSTQYGGNGGAGRIRIWYSA